MRLRGDPGGVIVNEKTPRPHTAPGVFSDECLEA